MRTLLTSAAFVILLTLSSCSLVQAPLQMAGGMVSAVGRTLHLSSENTRKADDFKIEARELREAVAVNTTPLSAPEPTGVLLAQR
jgi:hypothetical protein